MSSGQYCLIRDLGLVKGGKGLRHHEVVLTLSVRGIARFALTALRDNRWRDRAWSLDEWITARPRRAAGEAAPRPDIASKREDD